MDSLRSKQKCPVRRQLEERTFGLCRYSCAGQILLEAVWILLIFAGFIAALSSIFRIGLQLLQGPL